MIFSLPFLGRNLQCVPTFSPGESLHAAINKKDPNHKRGMTIICTVVDEDGTKLLKGPRISNLSILYIDVHICKFCKFSHNQLLNISYIYSF